MSTSEAVSVPVTVGVPGTMAPGSVCPASITVPDIGPATTGASLVPVMVIVTVSVSVPPLASLTVTSYF